MKKVISGALLSAILLTRAGADEPRFGVKEIHYKGDDVITGTFSFPTRFAMRRGEQFTVTVGGTAGVRLTAQNYLMPNYNWADGNSDAPVAMGKPRQYTIGPDGKAAVVWHINPRAELGVHTLRINEEGRAEPYWNGTFIIEDTMAASGEPAIPAGTGLTVQLVTGSPAKPIAGVKARLWSDNGIRCVVAPCPTNGREWTGTTDANGYLFFPEAMLDQSMALTPQGFNALIVKRDLHGVVTLPCTPSNEARRR